MAKYYIFTPDHDEARGPFTPAELQDLAETNQITDNTLYYDEPKQEWLAINLNPMLKNAVFPEHIQLDQESDTPEAPAPKSNEEQPTVKQKPVITIAEVLSQAEMETKRARDKINRERRVIYPIVISQCGMGLILFLFAVMLVAPQFPVSVVLKVILSDF